MVKFPRQGGDFSLFVAGMGNAKNMMVCSGYTHPSLFVQCWVSTAFTISEYFKSFQMS